MMMMMMLIIIVVVAVVVELNVQSVTNEKRSLVTPV
jgi:hypothetical protein